MNTKFLVEGIMQQTTVLIAQLSTAAGIRAPLAHVADRVFVDLAREIEAQGVGRKVVADMFGMALRTYQKRVQRLTESTSVRDKTLWQGVLDELQTGPCTRRRLRQRFEYDGEREVGAVLNDLVNSGLVYCTGRGDVALFGLTSAEARQALVETDEADAISGMLWLHVHLHEPILRAEALSRFAGSPALAERALNALLTDGTLQQDSDGRLRSVSFVVPVGSGFGWEAAVFDHFQAVVNAIGAKLRLGRTQSQTGDVVGGATLAFRIHEQHPQREAVLDLLRDTRNRVNQLWTTVRDYNQANPVSDDAATSVTFYFGQNVSPIVPASEEPQQ
jgi:hypothetical protein